MSSSDSTDRRGMTAAAAATWRMLFGRGWAEFGVAATAKAELEAAARWWLTCPGNRGS